MIGINAIVGTDKDGFLSSWVASGSGAYMVYI